MGTTYYNGSLGFVDGSSNVHVLYPKTRTSNVYNSSGQSLDTIISNLNTVINGKASSSHTHDDRYLKLTGGTMTGTIVTPPNDSKGIEPATDNFGQIGTSSKYFYNGYFTNMNATTLKPRNTNNGSVGTASYKYSAGYINTLFTTGGSVTSGNGCAVNGGQVSTAIASELNDGNEKDHFHVFDALGISVGNPVITFGNPTMHSITGSSIDEFSFNAHRDRIYLVSLSVIRYQSTSVGGSTMYYVRGKCTWLGLVYWLPIEFVSYPPTPVITKLHACGHYRYTADQAMDMSSYISVSSTSTLDFRNSYETIVLTYSMASAGGAYILGASSSATPANISTYGMAIPLI